jgi:sugar lactone lactonase YvrE
MPAAPLRRSVIIARALIPTIVALSSACGGSDTTTGPGATGSLLITVTSTGGPIGRITVSGPAGFSRSITSTTTLTGLSPGSYAVSADSAEVPDLIVGAEIFSGVVSNAAPAVTKSSTAQSTVAYGFSHRRGSLWIANLGAEQVENVAVDQLRASGQALPSTELFSVVPNGVAFDAVGNMWVAAIYEDTLRKFTVASRTSSGIAAPDFKLWSPSLSVPEQIAFDGDGTLWVSDYVNGLVGFSAAQQQAGISGVTAAYHVQDTLTTNPGIRSIAFDANGNAWVAYTSTPQLVEFTKAQLTVSTPQAPAIRIMPDNLANPVAMAFDASGNLWVADYDDFGVVRYTPEQLAAGGVPGASVKVFTDYPSGLAFDNSGSLWVTNRGANVINQFSAVQLTITDRPTPIVAITVNNGALFSDFGMIAFDPWMAAPPGSVLPPVIDRAHLARRAVTADSVARR